MKFGKVRFEKGTYRGVWGCNVSFSIKVLSIESNGTRVLANEERRGA